MTSFLDRLKEGPLVFDGAMGTQLYERGIFINKSFDDANLSNPALVQAIHADYVRAGADIISTNTFAANRIKLKRHGLEDKARDINRAGVELARAVCPEECFVAGSIGPTGQIPTMMSDSELEEIRAAYAEQASILAETGVDLIALETFRLLSEIRIAIEAIKSVCELPIVALMAFDSEHRTGDGATPERVARLLVEWGADVIGANCLEGPHVVFDVVEEMVNHGVPVCAMPNAGYPRKVDERLIYMATPEYFGVYARRFFKAGIAIVGGCCGTGPEHIQGISAAARMMGGGRSAKPKARLSVVESAQVSGLAEVPLAERSGLAAKLQRVWRDRICQGNAPVNRENFVVSVEVNPPAGLDPSKSINAAKMLQRHGIDVINIADGPRASVRMANWAMASMVQRELDMEVIVHLCGRDRNLLGLQSDVLAYHALGLNNLVVVTGDPPKVGDYPHATAVFDLDSIGILKMINNFNRGIDPAGRDVGATTQFFCACGAEPAAADYERELRRLEEKKAAGASFVMTQPVYDPAVLDKFLSDIEHLGLPVLVGILPLASYRNAEFLHNEVPGMSVPDDVRKRMKDAGEDAAQEGVKIAKETLNAVVDRVVGAYIMPPFGRYHTAVEVLSDIPGYSVDAAPQANDAAQR